MDVLTFVVKNREITENSKFVAKNVKYIHGKYFKYNKDVV